jgi:type IV pilus assembly protein PilE
MLTRASSGFTLIESMVALAVAGALAAVAYPSFGEQVRKARRSDAIVRIAMLQLAQERWRSGNASYGSLAEAGIAAVTSDGLYELSVTGNGATGYVALAQARGPQLRDLACRFMRLTVDGGNASRASGTDASVANGAALNDRCWNR